MKYLFLFSALSFFQLTQLETPVALANADCATASGLEKLVCLANAFKASLDEKQVAALQLNYSRSNAVRWSNFPQAAARPSRVGVSFGSLTGDQKIAARALLSYALSTGVANEGYDEFEGGMAADDYLGVATGKTNMFGSANFYIAFLGEPSLTGLWELQFGGHHYAFANTYNNGQLIGATPSFRGVEPMAPFTRDGKTYQPAEQEREAFAALINSLAGNEQSAARLSASFSDVLLGPGRDGQFPLTKQGLRIGDLSAEKKILALTAIKKYVNDLDPAAAKMILDKYSSVLNETYIAFTGSGNLTKENDYIRIDGPSIWIEYSVQPSRDFPGTTHPHSVWRDREGDYGGSRI